MDTIIISEPSSITDFVNKQTKTIKNSSTARPFEIYFDANLRMTQRETQNRSKFQMDKLYQFFFLPSLYLVSLTFNLYFML